MRTIDPNIEELLELLYIRRHEMRDDGPLPAYFSDISDNQLLEQAQTEGYIIDSRETALRLTPAGEEAGRDVTRRHRLAECLLRDVLGASLEDLHADACRIEHIIQHGLDEKICILLGHPATCPQDKPIPPGACCRRARADDLREVKPLCDGKVAESGMVAYLSTRENREIQKLMAMGILPGTQIKLLQRYPSYVFQMGFSQFTIDRELAEKIYVHWQSGARPDSAAGANRSQG